MNKFFDIKSPFKKSLSLNKYYAFTVAELAITIGVIGVIAAITMPLAQRHFQGIELETANSKLQLFLAETLEKMNADNTCTAVMPRRKGWLFLSARLFFL